MPTNDKAVESETKDNKKWMELKDPTDDKHINVATLRQSKQKHVRFMTSNSSCSFSMTDSTVQQSSDKQSKQYFHNQLVKQEYLDVSLQDVSQTPPIDEQALIENIFKR